jgi:hypothetical protein
VTVLVAVLMTLTVFELESATYAVLPLNDTATPSGPEPTPTVAVRVFSGGIYDAHSVGEVIGHVDRRAGVGDSNTTRVRADAHGGGHGMGGRVDDAHGVRAGVGHKYSANCASDRDAGANHAQGHQRCRHRQKSHNGNLLVDAF